MKIELSKDELGLVILALLTYSIRKKTTEAGSFEQQQENNKLGQRAVTLAGRLNTLEVTGLDIGR